MPRSTYATVGPLDPAFGIGFFEDDDYCRRVEAAGLGVACAEDVFVHHHLSASFDKLKAEARQQLFLKNNLVSTTTSYCGQQWCICLLQMVILRLQLGHNQFIRSV